ncbi:hypothetical protein SeMB42_g01420 [Synchytrium endobioticum]|uniref:Uncharacterized protein n=1 Tax=Synchytrium endobioticum TaxID=286115 RepID=A0A507DHL9_9FUNG|nr:hypothetical protein SeLEV6574_g00539 [Synchytrium endobioticum]TPX52433.1 hypothetical protein SeMB42_g01420 [Synchytrium endobioticum]
MGCACSTPSRERHGNEKDIDAMIREEKKVHKQEAIVLLLGAGAAGKSTVLKQMRLLHTRNGKPTFATAERKHAKELIHGSILRNMRSICDAMVKLNIPYGSPKGPELADLLVQQGEDPTATAVQIVQTLWTDPGIQECYVRRSEYQLDDSASFFFNSLARISASRYLPTDEDILLCRVKTTGVQEVVLEEDDLIIKVVDVGGQRSERRKWITCFEQATAVLFVAAVSEYDQRLEEQESRNRLLEAMTLFDQVINSRWFLTSHVILFLNKVDILEAKYKEGGDESVRRYWPDYQGTSFEDVLKYFQAKFLEVNQSQRKTVYTHFTCAVDRSSSAVVIESVKLNLMNQIFIKMGLV